MKKRILILTRSDKRREDGSFGCCVAGLSLMPEDNLKWIRLVASETGNSLSQNFEYKPLDIIEVEILRYCPVGVQNENYLIDEHAPIGFIKKTTIARVERAYDNNAIKHSFFGNMDKKVEGVPAATLAMIKAKDVDIYRDNAGNETRRVDFNVGNNRAVGVAMTDPEFNVPKGSGEHKQYDAALLVVSLPKEYPYTKFVAKVLPLETENKSDFWF